MHSKRRARTKRPTGTCGRIVAPTWLQGPTLTMPCPGSLQRTPEGSGSGTGRQFRHAAGVSGRHHHQFCGRRRCSCLGRRSLSVYVADSHLSPPQSQHGVRCCMVGATVPGRPHAATAHGGRRKGERGAAQATRADAGERLGLYPTPTHSAPGATLRPRSLTGATWVR